MEPEEDEREHAVALSKSVETAAANSLSAGVRRGFRGGVSTCLQTGRV